LGDPGGARLDFTLDHALGVGGLNNFRHTFPVQGLWLELSGMMPLNDRVSLFAAGSWLVPVNGKSDEDYVFFNWGDRKGRWQTSIQWYTLDGGGAFSSDGPVAVVAGFRYDSFEAGFSDPERIVEILSLPSDEANFWFGLYIPYVGLVTGWGSTLRVGFIGFPYLPGEVKYGQTVGAAQPSTVRVDASGAVSDGYFMEIFAQGGADVGAANIGLFGKWEYLRARATLDLDARFLGTQTLNDSVDLGFYRQCWTVGCELTLDFVSPL
jgi:hypothetical protein